jgi:hypothetical protein
MLAERPSAEQPILLPEILSSAKRSNAPSALPRRRSEEFDVEADRADRLDRMKDCRFDHAWRQSRAKPTLDRDAPFIRDPVKQLAFGDPD